MKNNRSIILFLVKFFATYFILFGLYSFYLNKSQVKTGSFSCASITKQVAEHTKTLASFFNYDASIEQNPDELSIQFFLGNQHAVNIVEGCSSISIIILFLAFIIAFKGNLKDTIFYGIFGSVLIYIVNLIRILLLAILFLKFPEHEYFIHNLMFPAIIYGLVFLLWVIWVNYFSHHNNLKKNG